MLTAMTAVDSIVAGRKDKANIWNVNTETEYQDASVEVGETELADTVAPK